MKKTGIEKSAQWPYPELLQDRQAGLNQWREVSEGVADYFRDVLPPIYFYGGFFTSEPCAHAGNVPIYAACVKIRGRYFMREVAENAIELAFRDLQETVITQLD